MSIPDLAATFCENIARDDSHGYDQIRRNGPDYDCSSLIITAYQAAGVPLTCTYTGNMRRDMLSHGFIEIAPSQTLKRGDVLLNEARHTAMYIGNGQIVQASINEKGSTTGGTTGDQTGREIAISNYYVPSYGWDCILRYEGEEPVTADENTELPMLANGSKGGAVKALQVLLINKWKISCGVWGADGDFGNGTKSAVILFQTEQGLAADGVVGPITWGRLVNAS